VTADRPRYSIVLPTYRRPDVLVLCLEHLAALGEPCEQVEVRVYDNGSPQDSRAVAEAFRDRLNLTYTLNDPGHGLGYSLSRGARECRGERVVELNDDALVPPDFLRRLDAVFDADPKVGVVGVRAVEDGYAVEGDGIGRIDPNARRVVGNFVRPTDGPVEVEHVYGFCYAYTRALLDAGGGHDSTLLAQDYSSGNRIETDQCLTAKRLGFKVVYDGRIAVRHLAKPRGDMSERSLRWRVNEVRNTLYLFLKHYGPFGRSALAARYCLLHDPGIVSAVRRPTRANWAYVLAGLRGRASAVAHYVSYLTGGRRPAANGGSR
jgi:GT2 family glycosyltransferase